MSPCFPLGNPNTEHARHAVHSSFAVILQPMKFPTSPTTAFSASRSRHDLSLLLFLSLFLASMSPEVAHASLVSRPFAPRSAIEPQEEPNEDSPSSVNTADEGKRVASLLPEELQIWLTQVGELQERGDLDGAREHLSGIVMSDAYFAMLEGSDAVALAGLVRIDSQAESLGILELQLVVQKERLRRLSAVRHEDDADLHDAMMSLAATFYAIGDLEHAHELFESLHSAQVRLLPPDHELLLSAKLNLAVMRSALGDLEGALELEEFVHTAWERLLPPDAPDLLAAKQNLAGTRYQLGDLEGALALFESLLIAQQRLLPPDHPDLLRTQQNVAGVRYVLGDIEGAHELFELVHAAWLRLLPPDDPKLLQAKQNLAATRKALGDIKGALEIFEFVHTALEKLLPPDHSDLLLAKANLGATRISLGDFEGAHELFEIVHSARERLLPSDHLDLLIAKQNLAATRSALGDLEGAHELLEAAHNTWERTLPPGHPDLLTAKANLARIRTAMGDHEGALQLAEFVHNARKERFPPDHPDMLHDKSNLAAARKITGDLAGALPLQEFVHSAQEQLLSPDHPDLLRTKANLAGTRFALGDIEGTHELLASILTGQDMRARALRRVAPRVARASAKDMLRKFATCLFLSGSDESVESASFTPRLFQSLELLRGVSIGSGATMRAATKRPELAGLLTSLESARAAVSDHRLSPPSADDRGEESELESWRAELIQLAEHRDALEKEVRGALADVGLDPVSPSAERVALGLGSDAVLIGFFRYPRIGAWNPETGTSPPTVDSLLALVVSKNGAVRRVELGRSDELERLAIQWRNSIGHGVGSARSLADESNDRGVSVGTSIPDEKTEKEIGTKLRERLIVPCLANLGDNQPAELHLILDDFLHLLPFDALPWNDEQRLGDAFKIRQETSGQRLAAGLEPFEGKGKLLAIGGVDYAADGDDNVRMPFITSTPPTEVGHREERSGANGVYEPLSQTQLEVETLGLMYKDMADGQSAVLTEAAASKKALFENAPAARYVHLATHGWFAPETFVSTLDSLEKQDDATLAGSSRADDVVLGYAPETLCGLALAGANHGTNSAGKVPGILTAEELGALDLSNCELAVLSACETNVGLRRAGQGIQSLQMALHTAGARTAITSLWRVDDAATRRLMELFYTNLWGEGLGKADSLWQAKMALREEGFGVKDWAAWVLTGDPR